MNSENSGTRKSLLQLTKKFNQFGLSAVSIDFLKIFLASELCP